MVKLLSKKACLALFAAAALAVSVSGVAKADLVSNGSFESITVGSAPGQLGTDPGYTQLTDWSVPAGVGHSYAFVFSPGTADGVGAYTPAYGKYTSLWGPGNGSANGLPATSPDGGNFIAIDGAFNPGALTQTLNGLTIGDTYQVGFYIAAAQQYGYDGTTMDAWNVSFGSSSQFTSILDVGDHGFSPWQHVTMFFVADSTSDVLSFFAEGTPQSQPPFALLDGVTVDHLPVPPGAVLAMTGLCMLVGLSLIRKAKAAKKAPALAV